MTTHVYALDPVSDRGEGPLTGHIIQQHHSVRSPEVGLSHGPEALLCTRDEKVSGGHLIGFDMGFAIGLTDTFHHSF